MEDYTVVLGTYSSQPEEVGGDDVLIIASPSQIEESRTLWNKLRGGHDRSG